MTKEQLKQLDYPLVTTYDGQILEEGVSGTFEDWLVEELLNLGMINNEIIDIIDYDKVMIKYGFSYLYIDNETELLEHFDLETLEL